MNFGSGPYYLRRSTRKDPAMQSPITGRENGFSANITIRHQLITSTRKITTRTNRNSRNAPYQRQPPRFSADRMRVECPICLSIISPVCRMKAIQCCGYVFCGTCITKCVKKFKACPMCNQKLTLSEVLSLRFCTE
ncbi:peroxisome assembly protein 10-B [Halyomorpha halys]|uniref:peroxisome assembly protein 10-B n=1 Tax=Halyomorpha halys TaxID=286706 RepID=UPI0006D4D104|nr:E3 ubiquitin-protein ligase RNF4-like [Halyomorpha halys]